MFHLDRVQDDIRKLYGKLKEEIMMRIPTLTFNPQRYYMSLREKRNFAFLKIRKKKIAIVAMTKENTIRNSIPHYHVETLSEPVQRFYKGDYARIDVTNDSHLDEILELLTSIQK